MKHWVNKIALQWLLGMKNALDENNNKILILPLSTTENFYSDFHKFGSQDNKSFRTYDINELILEDDGYDSSDMLSLIHI
jgi:hypothetical protein